MKNLRPFFVEVVLPSLLVCSIILGISATVYVLAEREPKSWENTPDGKSEIAKRVEGARAFKAGVPAQANPYVGQGWVYESRGWLDGWIEAAEQSKDQK